MNRRSFFRRFAKAVVVATVAPAALTAARPIVRARSIANSTGIYAQLQYCQPVGASGLNLSMLIQQMHELNRIRKPSSEIEIMTDRATADLIRDAMVKHHYRKTPCQILGLE